MGGTTYDYYPNGFTGANCSSMTASNAAIGATPAVSMAYVRDTRNNQTYRVKKMADNKCWMVDNLKHIDATLTYNNGDNLANGGSGAYNTIDESSTQSTANSDKAFYNNPMAASDCYSGAHLPFGSLTHCGYLYNWYAATNGTGAYAQSVNGTNVAGNICPANFRLPSGTSDGNTATGNGISPAAADFPVLNASMNVGFLTTGATTSSYRAGWQSAGSWGGMLSGFWRNGLDLQGSGGWFWSSTADSGANTQYLYFNAIYVHSGDNASLKYFGFSVRCVTP